MENGPNNRQKACSNLIMFMDLNGVKFKIFYLGGINFSLFRTQSQIKNRFFSFLRSCLKKLFNTLRLKKEK
jgi:hypothetical protein